VTWHRVDARLVRGIVGKRRAGWPVRKIAKHFGVKPALVEDVLAKAGSGLRELVAKARRDLSYAQSALTDISAALDALGVSDEIPRRNINGPVTAAGCPGCGVAKGHAADCPTLEEPEVPA
jgi:hypothetical protein